MFHNFSSILGGIKLFVTTAKKVNKSPSHSRRYVVTYNLLLSLLNKKCHLKVSLMFVLCRNLCTSSQDIGGMRDGNIEICLYSVSSVMILVNILLLVSAIREVPCQTLPWLCANTVIIVIAMVSNLRPRESVGKRKYPD